MENYTLKYRPKTFEDVVGQKHIVSILSNQIASGKWKSSYLFTGPFGCGKTTLGRIMANEINGVEGTAIEIDGASNNGVDNIRALIADAQQKSIDCKVKTYLIDEAHMLSTAAWNASLKLIEEPPKDCIFIFCTTDPQKIPQTILSRVQRFDLKTIGTNDIINRLIYICQKEGIVSYEQTALKKIAMLSNGHMRDAVKFLQQVYEQCDSIKNEDVESVFGIVSDEMLYGLMERVLMKSSGSSIVFYEGINASGINMLTFYDSFTSLAMDCLVYATTHNEALVDIPKSIRVLCTDKNTLYRLTGRLITFRKEINASNAFIVLKLIIIGEM